jgi:polysaccharide pyruvyl transferase WcaK-like protein
MTAISIPDSSVRNGSQSGSARRAPRIGIIYPSGWGNLGDEAILQATFEGLRERWPDVALKAFTLHPERTAAGHRVEAEFLTGVSRPMFLSARGDGPFLVRAAQGLARRTDRIPLVGRFIGVAADVTSTVIYEAASLRSAWRWLKTADLVLAAGGGQLDAVWGGAWGQPYALARWAWLARRARVPFAFLSVGYGGVSGRMSKRFLRYAVSQAAYCSVRDSGSRSLTRQLGVESELPVVPDLAFALSTESPLRPRRPGHDVGISPMVFMRPGNWPQENRTDYDHYVSLWADLVANRVAGGDRVHLFVTDPADMNAVRDVWARLDDATRAGCSVADANTPDGLLDLFRRLDVVVSSRLHGVLLAIVAGRPVLGLSHERKVRAVMADAGVDSFCLDLPTATSGQVNECLAGLIDQLEPCARRVREYATVARAAVRRQEEMLPQLLRHR